VLGGRVVCRRPPDLLDKVRLQYADVRCGPPEDLDMQLASN
jgi:hypothetical protein